MDDRAIARLLRRQEGVVSRRQVLRHGGDDDTIDRRIRGRAWARVHEGVHLHHTGPPTRGQREWAAVLVHAPAALAGASALRAHGVEVPRRPGRDVVGVAVDRSGGSTTRPVCARCSCEASPT